MNKTINLKCELEFGEKFFRKHCLPSTWNRSLSDYAASSYFKQYGFHVSQGYNDWYCRFSGVYSDQYVSMDLYLYYILPCLNRFEFWYTYTDKNFFSDLFPEVNQPSTVIKCMNGLFYDSNRVQLSYEEAVKLCDRVNFDCIIKPTLRTSDGRGVSLLHKPSENQLKEYGANFIVQRREKQHPEMARLNPSSLNTVRVYTYRNAQKEICFHKAYVRFGGEGSVKDNVSSGGGGIRPALQWISRGQNYSI